MVTLQKQSQTKSALVFFFCNNQVRLENDKEGQNQKQDLPEKSHHFKTFYIKDGEFVLEFLRGDWQLDDGVTLKFEIDNNEYAATDIGILE